MTNLVTITVRSTDDTASGFKLVKAKAAKAGDDAGKAFSDAFKLRADASINASGKAGGSGLAGDDKELLNKLKSFANTPGGIGILGTGNDTSLVSMLKRQIQSAGESGGLGLLGGSSTTGQSLEDTVRQQMVGNGPSNVNTTDMIKQVIEGNSPGNYSTKDFIDQVLGGNTPGNVNTTDLIKQVLQGNSPGNVSTEDIIRRVVEGKLPGNIDTTDTIHEKIDDSTIKSQGEKDGKTYGDGFASSLKNALSGLLGGKGGGSGGGLSSLLTGGGGEGEGGVSSALNSGGIAGGALPGIAGISGMQATIIGLGGALVSVLPAITSVIGGLSAIGGGFAILESTDKKFAADMTSTMGSIEKVFEAAAMPLAKPLEQAAAQVAGFFKSIGPQLKEVFASSATLIQPLVKGFEELMTGAGPGFLAMIKAAGPVFQTLSGAFANLGKSLGTMFSDFASDGAGSATVLKALLEVVNSLLPFIGELGKIMVAAVAPAFAAFGNAISQVLPALEPLLKVLGDLAGATLGDLAGVLASVGSLLAGLAPVFNMLAKTASNLFNTLENSGVFADLGDALEDLIPAIAKFATDIASWLVPLLPPLVGLLADVANILQQGLVTAVEALLPPLDRLATVALMGLNEALPVIIPLLVKLTTIFTNVAVAAISALATALSAIVNAIPPQVLADIVQGFLAVVAAVKLWTIAQGLLDIALDANPIGLFVLALGLLIGAIVEVYDHWNTIWNGAKEIFADFEIFMLEGLRDIVSAFTDYVGTTLNLAAKAFGWVPGVGGLLRTAASDFDTYRANVSNDFNTMINQAQSWRDSLSSFPKGVTTTLKLAGTGEISINASGAYIQGESGHITAYAAGTAAAAAGWAMVGEQGPELIKLNGGEQVVPNHKLPGFAGGTPGADLQWMQDLSKSIAGSFNVDAGTVFDKAFTKALAVAWAEHHLTAAASGGPGGGAPAANAALAKKLFPQWATGINWTDWNNVAMRESGWNQFATNPGSGAYGIPQALPFTKMPKAAWPASAGGSSNPTAQISWMAQYMESVYGGPQGAWAHELSAGWYDKGGWLPTGASIAINNTGRPEPVGVKIGEPPTSVQVTLEMASSGNGDFDAFMATWVKKYVRLKGGKGSGATDRAFAQN